MQQTINELAAELDRKDATEESRREAVERPAGPGASREAVERLAGPGAEAVPALVAAADGARPGAKRGISEALLLIGPPAFDAVVAHAAAERVERRPATFPELLRRFDERALDHYAAALGHDT
ncbi:hypothetical protein ABZU86_01070 [Streptomyces sp. NPDC005271]|uniref:hypothetical protein n=1 Tax=unclassified Streptomyces TaxID=2593676 RepID=UPI0033A26D5D